MPESSPRQPDDFLTRCASVRRVPISVQGPTTQAAHLPCREYCMRSEFRNDCTQPGQLHLESPRYTKQCLPDVDRIDSTVGEPRPLCPSEPRSTVGKSTLARRFRGSAFRRTLCSVRTPLIHPTLWPLNYVKLRLSPLGDRCLPRELSRCTTNRILRCRPRGVLRRRLA